MKDEKNKKLDKFCVYCGKKIPSKSMKKRFDSYECLYSYYREKYGVEDKGRRNEKKQHGTDF